VFTVVIRNRAGSWTVWDDILYKLPTLLWFIPNHTATAFPRNSTPLRRRVNIDLNACKCAITESKIFNSKCTKPFVGWAPPGKAIKFISLSQDSLGMKLRDRKGHKWNTEKEKKWKIREGKGKVWRERDNVPYWHLSSTSSPDQKCCHN